MSSVESNPSTTQQYFHHGLQENATVWEIFGGELFIDAVKNENPGKPFDVHYLTSEVWHEVDEEGESKVKHLKDCQDEEFKTMYYNEKQHFIRVVRFKAKPLNLD